MTLSNIEERLAALEPTPDDELAARILHTIDAKHCPIAVPTQIFAQVAQPTVHSSCFASSLPLLTGIAGTLLGAAVMFLAVTFFVPPKVEVREVVRYVHVETQVDTPSVVEDIKPDVPEPVAPPPKSQEPRELPWLLAWLYPGFMFKATDVRSADLMADLDAMIEQRAKIAKNSANMEPRPQFVRFERENNTPSEFSPMGYRNMIETWSL